MSQGEIDTAVSSEVAPTAPLPPRRKSWFRIRRDWPIVLLITTLVVGWILYAWIYPAIDIRHKIATTKWKYSPRDPEISYRIKFIQRTVEYLFVFWFFYLGASIGSFINVVANRTPRGKTIVTRGSHCPFCDTPLSMVDNSPVFGWILLRGRCRACRIPISPRYLIMEIIVGACFTMLGVIEVIGNGWNLPYRDWQYGAGIVSTVFYPKWDLIGSFAVHCGFFATCIMLLGSQLDRLRFPTLPLLILLTLSMVCVVALRPLAPVGWQEPFGPMLPKFPYPTKNLLLTTLLGCVAGWALGTWTQTWFNSRMNGQADRDDSQGIATHLDPNATNLTNTCSTDCSLTSANEQKSMADAWGWHWLVIHTIAGALFGWQTILVASAIAVVSLIATSTLSSLGKPTIRSDESQALNTRAEKEHDFDRIAECFTPSGDEKTTFGEQSPIKTEISSSPPPWRVKNNAQKTVLRADVLALAILTGTLFLHLCWWRWVVRLWHFS